MKINNQVKLEQLKLLHGSLLSSQIGMFLAGCILVYILKDVVARELLAMWLTFLILTIIYRLIIRRRFFFQLEQNNIELKITSLRFQIGVIISGLVWGSSSMFLYPSDSAVHQAYLGIIILGIVAASVGTLSPKKSAFTSFLLMAFIPLITQAILSHNQLSWSFSLLITLFLFISFISAIRFNKNILDGLHLKYKANKRTLELQNQENKYKFLFEKSEDPMLLISDYKLVLVNLATVKLLGGESLEQLLQMTQFDLSPTVQQDGTLSIDKVTYITKQLKELGFNRTEWLYKCFDGVVKPAEITSTIVPFEGGKAVYCIIRDISKIKETEQELIIARQKSEIANRSKSQFLANMSHEIRTPMNGVIGATNLLLQYELSEDQHVRAVTIKKSAESMLSILNNILDFSKIEAGKLELEIIEFELNQFIQEFSAVISNRIENKGLQFVKPKDSLHPVWLKGDVGRIKQILINLIDNAIKFTDSGEISLSYKTTKLEQNQIMLKFNISDTGIGISFKQQNLLFERFTQADSSTTRKYGGTGLGLSICKELTMLMDGDIGFKSRQDIGSQFWFTIKLGKIKGNTTANDSNQKHKNNLHKFNGNILIVDDNITNLEVAQGMLELFGLSIDLAKNGLEALNLLENNQYDLVFMDCQMPVMDGYDATKEIRKSQSKREYKNIPIIAMTANAMQGDREICLNSGMSDYLTKPVDLERFEALLIKWLPRSANIEPISHFPKQQSDYNQEDNQWFDYDSLLERLSGNSHLIKNIAKNFMPDLKLDTNQLILHIKNQNNSEITATSHKIKGSAATFGCNQLSQLMLQIETAVKNNENKTFDYYLDDINISVSRTLQTINKKLTKKQTKKYQ